MSIYVPKSLETSHELNEAIFRNQRWKLRVLSLTVNRTSLTLGYRRRNMSVNRHCIFRR